MPPKKRIVDDIEVAKPKSSADKTTGEEKPKPKSTLIVKPKPVAKSTLIVKPKQSPEKETTPTKSKLVIIKPSPEKKTTPTKPLDLPELYKPENKPKKWMMPNRIGYSDWVQEHFTYKTKEPNRKESRGCPLFLHQRFVRDYMQPNSPYRGLLLFHSVGTGKTRSSIAVAESLMSERDVMIMLPAALATNYINEIRRCGNPIFRNEQHWVFASNKETAKLKEASQVMGAAKIGADIIKKNKGMWYFKAGEPSNFNTLSSSERDSLEIQLDHMIKNKYEFLNYNGIKLKPLNNKIKENGGNNFFDNKLIIIDEVHNFVRAASNNEGKLTSPSFRLYKMLMEAKNTKVMCLSGTPMINRPLELSYLLNLVRGYITLYTFKFKNRVPLDPEIYDLLEDQKTIDYFVIRNDHNDIQVGFLPEGFEFIDKKEYMLKPMAQPMTMEEQVANLVKTLQKAGIRLTDTKTRVQRIHSLPIDEELFEKTFVNFEATEPSEAVHNRMLLSRRVQGLVSFYDYYDPADYPEQLPTEYVTLPMSGLQFQKYLPQRLKEIESDSKSKFRGKGRTNTSDPNKKRVEDAKFGTTYRSFSRGCCNFVFPEKITRPYPSTMKKFVAKEMDTFDEETDVINDEDEKVEKESERLYEIQLANAIKQLTTEDLTTNLATHSPKFAAIVKKIIESKWLSLAYTQFRRVEGVALLGKALDAHGFTELKLKKVPKTGEYRLDIKPEEYEKPKYIQFTGMKDVNKILLDIFNSDFEQLPPGIFEQIKEMHPDWAKDRNHHGQVIKLLMITQSGAEGISLKDVREVHLIEPYWNDVRIQQVIGRAIRAKSHLALPESERNVKIYNYQMKFADSQKGERTLTYHDKNLTSDQYVASVAQIKSLFTNGLLGVLKDTAVDCYLHKEFTKRSCFKPLKDEQGANRHVFTQDELGTDLLDEETDQMKVEVKVEKVFLPLGKVKGVKYFYDEETMLVYKHDDIANKDLTSPVGKLESVEKKKVKWF